MRLLFVSGLCAVFCLQAAEVAIKISDLPPVVRKAADAQVKGAALAGVNKETKNGKTTYEIETKVASRTRDVLLDDKGVVVEVEEETDLAAIPAAARAALRKSGKVAKVEKLTKGAKVAYEAAVRKNGKNSEVAVNADGSPYKN